MRDMKTIDLGFTFQFSKGGQIADATEITVCEPGYDKRAVYRRMQGYVAQAQKGLLRMRSEQRSTAAPAPTEPPLEGKSAAEPEAEPDALFIMRMGLSVDEYEAFASYVQRELTNNKSLAFVGSNPDDRSPVGEDVWMSLDRHGNMDAIDKILSEFAGFFLSGRSTRPSPTESGTS